MRQSIVGGVIYLPGSQVEPLDVGPERRVHPAGGGKLQPRRQLRPRRGDRHDVVRPRPGTGAVHAPRHGGKEQEQGRQVTTAGRGRRARHRHHKFRARTHTLLVRVHKVFVCLPLSLSGIYISRAGRWGVLIEESARHRRKIKSGVMTVAVQLVDARACKLVRSGGLFIYGGYITSL